MTSPEPRLTPFDALVDIITREFIEIEDPAEAARIIIQRLDDVGFQIR